MRKTAKPARRRQRRGGVGGRPAQSLLTPMLVSGVNNNTTTRADARSLQDFSGEEYLGLPINVSNLPAGSIVFNKVIDSTVAPRLRTVAAAWQRWHVKKLEFKIIPLNGSTATSGYTAAFIDDPSFPVETDDKSIVNLTAFRNTTVRQNWVAGDVNSDLKWTDSSVRFTTVSPGGDVRLSSPGRLVIQLNGTPTATAGTDITFAIFMKYTVSFETPGVVPAQFIDPGFQVNWKNDDTIFAQGTSNGYIDSFASRIGLIDNVRYYVNEPIPLLYQNGPTTGSNFVYWCVGFVSGTSFLNTTANARPIVTNDPSLVAEDRILQTTGTFAFQYGVFYPNTGFSLNRPTYGIRPAFSTIQDPMCGLKYFGAEEDESEDSDCPEPPDASTMRMMEVLDRLIDRMQVRDRTPVLPAVVSSSVSTDGQAKPKLTSLLDVGSVPEYDLSLVD